jgi:hypothetical protein
MKIDVEYLEFLWPMSSCEGRKERCMQKATFQENICYNIQRSYAPVLEKEEILFYLQIH